MLQVLCLGRPIPDPNPQAHSYLTLAADDNARKVVFVAKGRDALIGRMRNRQAPDELTARRLPREEPQSRPPPAGPMPAIVHSVRERAEVLSGASFNSVLLNLYRNGRDSVGWHSDHEAGLGERPTIASLSLGGARRFQFRHRRTKETITLELRSGDWLMMRGETQRFWVHQVPKTAPPVDPRVNLTFRRMIS